MKKRLWMDRPNSVCARLQSLFCCCSCDSNSFLNPFQLLYFNGYQYVITTLFFNLAEITPVAPFLTCSPLLQENVPITQISCRPLPPSFSNYIMPK